MEKKQEHRKENGRGHNKGTNARRSAREREKGIHSLPITPSVSLVSADLNQDLTMKH